MKLYPILFIFLCATVVVSFYHCATPAPPGGGLKDSISPFLMATSVPFGKTEFEDNKLVFFFTENISVKNISSQISLNPVEKQNKPEIFYEANRLVFLWQKALTPQTTYSINLGNSISDYNEGNRILEKVHFAFSTGKKIDSNSVFGSTVIASSGLADSTIIVTLYKDLEDSALILKGPTYKTSVDTLGRYVFWNVSPGSYRLYAMKDNSYTGKYINKNQLFAFADSIIEVKNATTQTPMLRLFQSTSKKKEKPKKRNLSEKTTEEILISYKIRGGKKLSISDSFALLFNSPLQKLDSSKVKIELLHDSLPPEPSTVVLKLTATDSLPDLLHIDTKRMFGRKYQLILDSGFVVDTSGAIFGQTDTITFSTYSEDEYGSAEVSFEQLDKQKNAVLLRIYKEGSTDPYITLPLDSSSVRIPKILSGKYKTNLLIDVNRNGVWNYGSFWKKKSQPEEIIPLKEVLEIIPSESTSYIINLENREQNN